MGARRQMTKLTIAPQLTTHFGFWSRPVLRAFITYAQWNDAASAAALADDTIGVNGVYGLANHGLNYGFQAEVWR